MSGFITIERDIWQHQVFKPSPMSEREAWIWMISRAAWVGTTHRVGADVVEVARGSFMATLREMQGAFMWESDKRVRNFIKKLENHGMLTVLTLGQRNARKTHLTICNYDEYQSGGRSKDAAKTHEGRTKDAVKKQGNKVTTEESTNVLLQSQPIPVDDTAMAFSAYNSIAERVGWPVVQKVTPSRRSAVKARIKDCGGYEAWHEAMQRAEKSPFLSGKKTGTTPASFDWLNAPKNFTKLMEGNYDERNNAAQSASGTSNTRAGGAHQSLMAGFAEVANRDR